MAESHTLHTPMPRVVASRWASPIIPRPLWAARWIASCEPGRGGGRAAEQQPQQPQQARHGVSRRGSSCPGSGGD